ncbi:hypothetical protein RclHR1_14950004 [Rhizophagus clarus]|uniref:F-box domain-containing protein n=1 Tax=Rhizophagus clarus TaxID=94130 RepID=A0A2Z6QT75_9GLOM|nr:hypothetical protein RclHR1_14950004 [Rhizophagus clarus]
MSNLDEDILYLIFEELKDDGNALFSSLEIKGSTGANWKSLENAFLSNLKILNAKYIEAKYLARLIKNIGGNLCEINIDSPKYDNFNNQQELFQAIAQNCPNLKYLMLVVINGNNINELEKIIINCQYMNGLVIVRDKYHSHFDWEKLFEMLIKSSPINLNKFKFYIRDKYPFISLGFLNLFLNKWKGRHPMLLHTVREYSCLNEFEKYFDLLEKYKAEGIIKKYEIGYTYTYEDFEWIKKKTGYS